jgi:hypothetical protein
MLSLVVRTVNEFRFAFFTWFQAGYLFEPKQHSRPTRCSCDLHRRRCSNLHGAVNSRRPGFLSKTECLRFPNVRASGTNCLRSS